MDMKRASDTRNKPHPHRRHTVAKLDFQKWAQESPSEPREVTYAFQASLITGYPRRRLEKKLRAEIRDEWAQYLRVHVWDHYVTLTFSVGHSYYGAKRAFERWIRHLERKWRRGVAWFLATETGGNGRIHLHALLQGTETVSAFQLAGSWLHGRADANTYDDRRGAAPYITKAVGMDDCGFEVSERRWQRHPAHSNNDERERCRC